MTQNILDNSYITFLDTLKKRVEATRYKAAARVNQELILLYHHIGTQILKSQAEHGWGAKVIDQLSRDLKSTFSDMKGFSPRNLKYMRKFAEEYPETTFVQQVAAQLPWFHIALILDKVARQKDQVFYFEKTVEHGWSRSMLTSQIEKALHIRQGQSVNNFNNKLPSPLCGLAHETLKDPYIFDFLGVTDEAQEREVENALIKHMEKFLLELGAGFAFVGRQYHLEVSKRDYDIDLLFYHLNYAVS